MGKDTRFKLDPITAIMLAGITGAAVVIAALPHLVVIPGGMVIVDPGALAAGCLAVMAGLGFLLTPWLFVPMRRVRKR